MLQLPKVVGHRGAAAYAPENTLESFREAKRRGAAWVEIDVKLAGDGTPILMHDASLKRTLGVDRLASDLPWAEISRLDAGSWFGAPFAGEPVPSFEQAIACLVELGLGANVEIKPCAGREVETAEAVVEILKRPWQALAASAALELQGCLARRRLRGRPRISSRPPDRRIGR